MNKSIFLLFTALASATTTLRAQAPVIIKPMITVKAKAGTLASMKINARQTALAKKPLTTKTISVLSDRTQVIDVSNVAKFPIEEKKVFTTALINENCNALPVNYRSSQQELGLFFPARNFKDGIFPGAVYTFSTIKNQSPTPYTKFTTRNPMDLTTDIFDARVTDNRPVEINRFDFGTISSKWSNILSKYINGATPADVITEVILVESTQQMNSNLGTAGTVDVGAKISAPIPNIPVTVDASSKVTVTNTSNITSSSENTKNTVILRFKQVFYSARMSYQADKMDIFPGADKSQLENDLVYVYSVDYGQMFYVVITSEFNKDALYKAVMNKVSTQSSLGVTAIGAPVSGSVTVGTENQTTSETNSVFSSNKTTIKTFQYGGEAVNLGSTIDEVINSLKSKIKTKFDASNLGAPISYTLNFVADHSPAWINTNVSYATANCGVNLSSRKYDVKIKLEKLKAPKVVDADNNEDLYGSLSLAKFELNGSVAKSNLKFWEKDGETYDEKSISNTSGITKAYKDSYTNINVSKTMATNISNDALRSAKLFVTGDLKDKELFLVKYVCDECNGSPLEIKLSNYMSQIDAMQPGETKSLKFGNDNFFELNFFEGGNKDASHVRTLWSVEITAK